MMSEDGRAANGDFHIIRMDGLFHVVFRPDSDPEWFRIIATFFTYERAYIYCDIERVSVWKWKDEKGETFADSATGDEEIAGLRPAPVHLEIPTGGLGERDGVAELVRGVYDGGEHVLPRETEDFSEHPNENEGPKDYHTRLFEQAISREADKPICAECGKPRSPGSASLCRACYRVTPPVDLEPLSAKQEKVMAFFRSNANPMRLVNATYTQIANGSGVLKHGASQIVDALARKGLLEIVERGMPGMASVFRLAETPAEAERVDEAAE